MTNLTYRCPKGSTVLRADNAKSLRDKITTHNITSHGAYPINLCGRPIPMRTAPPEVVSHAGCMATRRLVGLGKQGV